MIKRKLFIGSSTQGLDIAQKVKTRIEEKCSEWLSVKLWSDDNVFKLTKSTLENLQEKSMLYDYGVLIATSDDVGEIKEDKCEIMRDNVLFEAGMFLATLGRERAFIMIEKGCRIPSDLNGQTLSIFSKDESGMLDSCINDLIIELNNTKNNFRFGNTPSTALALGYFKNYVCKLIDGISELGIENFKLKILIPLLPINLKYIIETRKTEEESFENQLYTNKPRPSYYKTKNGENWDIPTTIEILVEVIKNLFPSSQLNLTKRQKEYLKFEVKNFADALNELIKENYPNQNIVKIQILEY